MNNNKYSDSELHLMSYQELRRLSNLLQLPANIKKKYMIPMIQAHQKGDGGTKTAIANQIMEERKVKRLSGKRKQSKPYLMTASASTQQIPTDLSVSTKHEFETRFSYVAHYTSKDEINSGISRIIKQEAEVSRRDRSILQQQRKPTRKLATVGRTEIMLPRNHSLTTPVRLMPQYERGFPSGNEYDSMSGLSNGKNHFQDMNSYNYHFHGEFSNTLMPTTSHELYRNEPYWHTREVYNNSLMPILSSLLTPNPVTINSSGYASQYTSNATMKGPSSFQGVYEKYIKSESLVENQGFQSSVTNSSTVILNNHFSNDNNNNYGVNRGGYLITKNDVDFDITSTVSDINCQHYGRREDAVMRNSNGTQACLVDFYMPRNEEPGLECQASAGQHIQSAKNLSQCNNGCFKSVAMPGNRSFETTSMIAYNRAEVSETDDSDREAIPTLGDYETKYPEQSKDWEEEANGGRKLMERNSNGEKDNFMDGFLTTHGQGSFFSESSTDFSVEMDLSEKLESRENLSYVRSNFPRCRYVLGHSKYPEPASKLNKTSTSLPFFWTTFRTNAVYNKAYSLCKNSFTGTTETHLNPIMTCSYSSQFASHVSSQQPLTNNTGNNNQIQRQWLYPYPETQAPFSLESTTYTTWDEYSDEMDNKIVTNNNGHEVQVVKCRKHGCHYLYSISNPCD